MKSSKEKNSKSIRKLLEFSLAHNNREKENCEQYEQIKNEISALKDQQEVDFKNVLNQLKNNTLVQNSEQVNDNKVKEIEKIEQSVNNSIDSLLSSFGTF